jgi:large subunit ribosomal protein L24
MINKLKIRKGDTVKVISGKDKGKTGKVIRVVPKTSRVVVENVNLHTKFAKAKQAGQPGQKVVSAYPFHISKVMLVDSNSGETTRVGYKILDNGTKQRTGKSSGKAV